MQALWLAASLIFTASAQTPSKVDFARDVQPIFQQNCIGCHGPDRQMNGFRLDRRSIALRKGGIDIIPGNSGMSRLYLRLIGQGLANPMPPTGKLPPETAAVIKAWIDQGAPWPDELANEIELPPTNARAVQMIDALHKGDTATFDRIADGDPKLLNARGPGGSTPFMYASLYRDAAALARLLALGADPNVRNDHGATALHWGAGSLVKVKLLLDHKADPNIRSKDGRTPLHSAATFFGSAPVLKLLLAYGANPNPPVAANATPLREAALAGDAEAMRVLIEAGANVLATGAAAIIQADSHDCSECLALVGEKLNVREYSAALLGVAPAGKVATIRFLLDHKANINIKDPEGRTPLIFATSSDNLAVDAVRLLIEHGADVNVKTERGLTALDYAKLHGDTPIVRLLTEAGAVAAGTPNPKLEYLRAESIPAAIQRVLPKVQEADLNFTRNAGCVSCHNQGLTQMAVGSVRRSGLPVNEAKSAQAIHYASELADTERDFWFEAGIGGAGISGQGYLALALYAANQKPSLTTDALAYSVKIRQSPDGNWGGISAANPRPPLGPAVNARTATALRVLQLFAPTLLKTEYQEAIDRAGRFLATASSATNEQSAWRLAGLGWYGKDKIALEKAKAELLATQRPDGGWADLPSMATNSFSTGLSLYALQASGVKATDPAFKRGVEFLLNTQLKDGSWYVPSRSIPIQPYFDAGFPFGTDQWISIAGTDLAVMALSYASK